MKLPVAKNGNGNGNGHELITRSPPDVDLVHLLAHHFSLTSGAVEALLVGIIKDLASSDLNRVEKARTWLVSILSRGGAVPQSGRQAYDLKELIARTVQVTDADR